MGQQHRGDQHGYADYKFMAHLEYNIYCLYYEQVIMPERGIANDCWSVSDDDRRWFGLSIQFRMATRRLSSVNL
jgi:hypothetical protein